MTDISQYTRLQAAGTTTFIQRYRAVAAVTAAQRVRGRLIQRVLVLAEFTKIVSIITRLNHSRIFLAETRNSQ
jgi:hypothetical protein